MFWNLFLGRNIIYLLFIIVPVLESSPFFVLEYEFCEYYILLFVFSSEAVLQSLLKIDPTENKSMP